MLRQLQEPGPGKCRAWIPVVALAEGRAHVGMAGDAAPSGHEPGGVQAADRDPVSRAQLTREDRGCQWCSTEPQSMRICVSLENPLG